MSDQNSLLINTKQEIRSLLLAEKNGLPLRQFLKAYRGMVGHNLPFTELGYPRVEDFLFSITDVVQMKRTFDDLHLWAIADSSTKHIEKLVQRQKDKVTKFSKSVPPRFRNLVYPKPMYQQVNNIARTNGFFPPRVPIPHANYQTDVSKSKIAKENTTSNVTKKISTSNVTKETSTSNVIEEASASSISKKSSQTIISEQKPSISKSSVSKDDKYPVSLTKLKEQIIDIINQNESGVSLVDLQLLYITKYGTKLDFSAYNFDSLEQCLEDIPGLQPKNINGKIKIFYEVPRISSPKPPTEETSNSIFTWPSLEKTITVPHAPNSSLHSSQSGAHNEKSSKEIASNVGNKECQINGINELLIKQFKEILNQRLDGISDKEFMHTYKIKFSQELNLKCLGYNSLIELVKSLPKVFAYCPYPDSPNDYMLFSATSESTQKVIPPTIHEKVQLLSVSSLNDIISNIRKILQANSDGVYIDDFYHMYYLNTETTLNLTDLGYNSLTSFFQAIKDKVPLKFDYSNVRTKICLAFDSYSSASSSILNPNFPEIPPDAVIPGLVFMPQNLPVVTNGAFFPIYIGCVLTPSSIYIQLKEMSSALRILSNNLEKLYESPEGDKYIMQSQHIVIGAVCAAVWTFDGNWYRATIAAVDIHHVNVVFADYGNAGKVSKEKLRYLKKDHLNLPAQAIKARMACIAPVEEDWDDKAREFLLKNCQDRLLMCEVVQPKKHYDLPSVWLCDTSGEEDKHINLLLIQENLAINVDEQSTSDQPPDKDTFMKALWTMYNYQQALNTLTSNFYGIQNYQPYPSKVPFTQPLTIMNPNCFFPNFNVLNNPSVNYPAPQPNCNYSAIPTMQQSINSLPISSEKPFINPPTSSTNTASATCDSPSSFSSEELFESADEDDALYSICQQQKKYVHRLNFQLGYKIHIIILQNLPYVPSDDVASLFWSSENGIVLQRRLQQNSFLIPTVTISIEEYPVIFKQLKCLKVKGVQEINGVLSIVLFRLKDLNQILNAFGHPSPFIRSEVKQELTNFDPNTDLWKNFSEICLNDDDNEEEPLATDSSKFNRLCSYDLKASLEGFKYKLKKLQKDLNDKKDSSIQTELERINDQCYMYEQRIKEIERYSLER